ncbi:MAG: DUF1848 domain-containing protein [Deltaproteobacteria bacterium]|jgi:hypothetical protein|nr:DUF1848 domain-containing protein [Deltaproteobacteria bacterium]
MIVSCSRRTDVPALYAEWIENRLKAGYALVPWPYNRKKLTWVTLTPEAVDCLVFWTKNPRPLLDRLDAIMDLGFQCYFQFTLNPYDVDLEPHLPPKKDLTAIFQKLSRKLGSLKVDWRYDPIIIDAERTVNYHLKNLAVLGAELAPYASRLIISFVDQYRGIGPFNPLSAAEIELLAAGLGRLAASWGLPVYTCAEKIDLSPYGIYPGACVDEAKISQIVGRPLGLKKDPGQRRDCLCRVSVDLGVYSSCSHLCAYCYANSNKTEATSRPQNHDPNWPSLTGPLTLDQEIVRRL